MGCCRQVPDPSLVLSILTGPEGREAGKWAPSTVGSVIRGEKKEIIVKSAMIGRNHSDGRFFDDLSLAPCKGRFIPALTIDRNDRKA